MGCERLRGLGTVDVRPLVPADVLHEAGNHVERGLARDVLAARFVRWGKPINSVSSKRKQLQVCGLLWENCTSKPSNSRQI